jgi:membrane fusion protein (multidrug efflux system)
VLAYFVAGSATYYLTRPTYVTSSRARIETTVSAVEAPIAGHVLHVHVHANQAVQAGDLLVELDPTSFRFGLEDAHTGWLASESAARETDRAGAASQDARLSKLSEASSALALAEARLLEGAHDSPPPSAAGREASADAETAARAQALTRAAQSRRLSSALGSVRVQLEDIQREARQQHEAHQATLPAGDMQRHAAKTRYEEAKRQLSNTAIHAPVSGLIGAELPTIGEQVAPGRALLSIWQNQEPWVSAHFDESELPRIQLGQPVRLHVVALDLELQGTVDSIGFASALAQRMSAGFSVGQEPAAQRVPVRVTLSPGQARMAELRPGMTVVTSVRTP